MSPGRRREVDVEVRRLDEHEQAPSVRHESIQLVMSEDEFNYCYYCVQRLLSTMYAFSVSHSFAFFATLCFIEEMIASLITSLHF